MRPARRRPRGAIFRGALRLFTRLNIFLFRLSRGWLIGKIPFAAGREICLVSMTGRKTGRQLRIPLLYVPHGNGVVLVASHGGTARHPNWYHNLIANPRIQVQTRRGTVPMHARPANSEEKAALWPRICQEHWNFDTYQQRVDRDIPVFICERVGG